MAGRMLCLALLVESLGRKSACLGTSRIARIWLVAIIR